VPHRRDLKNLLKGTNVHSPHTHIHTHNVYTPCTDACACVRMCVLTCVCPSEYRIEGVDGLSLRPYITFMFKFRQKHLKIFESQGKDWRIVAVTVKEEKKEVETKRPHPGVRPKSGIRKCVMRNAPVAVRIKLLRHMLNMRQLAGGASHRMYKGMDGVGITHEDFPFLLDIRLPPSEGPFFVDAKLPPPPASLFRRSLRVESKEEVTAVGRPHTPGCRTFGLADIDRHMQLLRTESEAKAWHKCSLRQHRRPITADAKEVQLAGQLAGGANTPSRRPATSMAICSPAPGIRAPGKRASTASGIQASLTSLGFGQVRGLDDLLEGLNPTRGSQPSSGKNLSDAPVPTPQVEEVCFLAPPPSLSASPSLSLSLSLFCLSISSLAQSRFLRCVSACFCCIYTS
jgi:hypothetical protein